MIMTVCELQYPHVTICGYHQDKDKVVQNNNIENTKKFKLNGKREEFGSKSIVNEVEYFKNENGQYILRSFMSYQSYAC